MNLALLAASCLFDRKTDLAVLAERVDTLTTLVWVIGGVALLALVLTAGKSVARLRITTKR